MSASLLSTIGFVQSICGHLLRVVRHLSDAAASYDDVGIELESVTESVS